MRLAGRSPRELGFRVKQAVANAVIRAFPPHPQKAFSTNALPLPDGKAVRDRLKNSLFQQEVIALAEQVLRHRWPLFDSPVEFGPNIDWRRDYVHSKTSGTGYFRSIPYLDFETVGDHKYVWELNRHQHLVVLAQAYLFTGAAVYCAEIETQMESWWAQNPYLKGINWASALEVAFRALSWLWIDHLVGGSLPNGLRERILSSLYQHGVYLRWNLSTYFSPNTHLLGEAVALHAVGLRLNESSWSAEGARILAEELKQQVAADGSHVEQSTYYHVYALDLFLLHYLLSGRPEDYRDVLVKMTRFLIAVIGPARLLTPLGDDDGGRLFHPFGPRGKFARGTLATCAVLFPDEHFALSSEDLAVQAEWFSGASEIQPRETAEVGSRLFEQAGLACICFKQTHVLMDAGPFGFGGAGHSHADTLSVTVRAGERELLIDPGTFTYVADPEMRNRFRGTGFHNTIRINKRDQAEPAGPFRWKNKPTVQIEEFKVSDGLSYVHAYCRYEGFEHRRRVLSIGDDEWLFVLDEVSGPAGPHTVEQFWHLGDREVKVLLDDPGAAHLEDGFRSRVFGQKESAPVMRAAWWTPLPHFCGAALQLSSAGPAELVRNGRELTVPGTISVFFFESGMPVITRVRAR